MFSFWNRINFQMRVHCFERRFIASPPLVPVPLPSRMETHLWYIVPDEVKSTTLLDKYLDLLSLNEKENVFRMRGDQLQKRALLTRALVRTTIARYQINPQVTPRSLKFRKNIYGKPEVEWQHDDEWHPPPLHFNISHSSSLIACGVTMNVPIGIDVEEKSRKTKNNVLSFAQRYFSPREMEFLASISDPEVQRQEFIKLWTLKEAYVKALGRGFSAVPFKTFTIQFGAATRRGLGPCDFDSEASEIVVDFLDDSKILTSNWQFALIELDGSHFAAICVKKDNSIGAGKENAPMRLTVWKTIPLVEDECVSGTDAVTTSGSLT
ncbi:uncharacterized protein LOC131152804 isoform X3 [Malania oleifera]|uniref:uncharacterized protein LOC131152804 isoform X3 n=1 Tax=Malania oleifera TaxID=397392 RepID=UPI0025ADF370|nr:uncharacterized protein LOC131152804 isoform X3 [Malania oleifera]XP_057960686.1 uncharacterized protein LOC131152804 isoform X3 [Malania oleifera]